MGKTIMICTFCGKNINETDKFCGYCGNCVSLPKMLCKSCGAEISEDLSFCTNCGRKIDKNETSKIDELEEIHTEDTTVEEKSYKICPKCNKHYPPEYPFCLECVEPLIDVNNRQSVKESVPSVNTVNVNGYSFKKCPKCNHEWPGDYEFCLKCNISLDKPYDPDNPEKTVYDPATYVQRTVNTETKKATGTVIKQKENYTFNNCPVCGHEWPSEYEYCLQCNSPIKSNRYTAYSQNGNDIPDTFSSADFKSDPARKADMYAKRYYQKQAVQQTPSQNNGCIFWFAVLILIVVVLGEIYLVGKVFLGL